MGLLDTLLGRTKPVKPNLDALFALPTALVTLQTAAGLQASGHAGVVWKPPAGQSAEDVQHEIAQLLSIPDDEPVAGGGTGPEPGTAAGSQVEPAPTPALRQSQDTYGYRWLLLDDPDAGNLVSRVHLVNSDLSDNGWGPLLLCSVFGLVPTPDAGPEAKPLFLVYLFKRGTFYPFAPTGPQQRDSELELRIRAVIGSDLPVEQDVSRWFPMWDMPLR